MCLTWISLADCDLGNAVDSGIIIPSSADSYNCTKCNISICGAANALSHLKGQKHCRSVIQFLSIFGGHCVLTGCTLIANLMFSVPG